MRAKITAAVVCLFIASPALADWSVHDMNYQIDQTNFVVNDGCSGTLIDVKNRYILTASHCVGAQYEVIEREKVKEDGTVTTEKIRWLKPGTVRQIAFQGSLAVSETTYRTEMIAVDKVRDLALIQVVGPIASTTETHLACGTVSRGDPVYVVGNPKGLLYSSVVRGIVSSLQRTYATIAFGDGSSFKQPLMQISAGVIGGNSGGAVYDDAGELIGVPVLANTQNEILGFAVPLDVIKGFLADYKLDAIYAYCAGTK